MLKARTKPQPIAKPTHSIVGEQQAYPSMQVSPTPSNLKPVAIIKRKQPFPKVPITRPILRREATTQTASTEFERIPSKLPVMSLKPVTAEIATQTPDTVSAGPKTMMQDLLHGSEPDTTPITDSLLAYSPTKPLTVNAATQTPKPITVFRPAASSTKRQGGVAATQTPTAAADPMPVLPNLLQGSEPDMIPIAVPPPTLTPALEERSACTAIAQYHSCGCRASGTPMFFCTDQYCKHPQPALVAIARLPFSCTTRYSGNVRPGMGRGHECRAADPNSVFFTREADTAGAFDADGLLVLKSGAVQLRDLPSVLPCEKFWKWAYEVRHRYEDERSRKGDPIACGIMAPPPARAAPNAGGEAVGAMAQKDQRIQGQSAKQKQQQQIGAQPDQKSGEKMPLQKKPRQKKPRRAKMENQNTQSSGHKPKPEPMMA
ncbi:hypothetical protein DL766_001221 [Monosporascus sp. MC13-8B]|nr:hypothetical protein DL766_001221 [Monosporascus sp. MC13-8B]